jgi:acyl-CoA hydrolase
MNKERNCSGLPDESTLPVDTIVKTEVVCPNDTNPMGILSGGKLVSWMDIAAAVAAQTYSGRICVTVAIRNMEFHHPVRTGDIVRILARVTDARRSSMDIRVTAMARTYRAPEEVCVSDALFVFVAINEQGLPTPLRKASGPAKA